MMRIALRHKLVQLLTFVLILGFLPVAQAAAPVISSASPSTINGEVGGTVTLTGSGFTGATAVNLGNSSASFSVVNDGSLTITVPPSATYGAVDVKVTNSSGNSTLANAFSYTAPPTIVVTSVSPSTVNYRGGGSITINGSGFNTKYWASWTGVGRRALSLGGAYLTVTSFTDTQIVATIPSTTILNNPTLRVDTYNNSFEFNNFVSVVQPPNPTITSISVASGSILGGYSTTLTGTGFLNVNYVYFGNNSVYVTPLSDTQLQVNVPSTLDLGTVDVKVVNPWNDATLSNAFTYEKPTAPTITAISPSIGLMSGGTQITITGSGFGTPLSGYTSCVACNKYYGYVKIGSNFASVTSYTGTQIVATLPVGTMAGIYDVTVGNYWNSGTLAGGFTYNSPAQPTITSITPNNGTVAGGTTVTIIGTGFSTGSYSSSLDQATYGYLSIGGKYIYPDIKTATSLTFTMPAGTNAGPSDVHIWNGWTGATFSEIYTYNAIPSPTITSISPNSISMTTTPLVTISGTNLENVTSISVGGTSRSYASRSNTQLTFYAPTSLFSGAVDVRVLTSTDSATVTSGLTYVPVVAPTITSLDVTSGTAAGGTVVTVTGSGFRTQNQYYCSCGIGYGFLKLDGVYVSTSELSDTQLRFTTPSASKIGSVNLEIGNFWGSTVLANAFTYVKPPSPTITSISSNTGSAKGGNALTIQGTNLSGISTVKIGTFAANIQAQNASQITVLTPRTTQLGTVDVSVFSTWDSATVAGAYTLTAPLQPTITSISPNSASQIGGTSITIYGSGFSVPTYYTTYQCNDINCGYVRFGSIFASVTSFTDSQIVVNLPAGSASGLVDVQVVNYWNSAAASAGFTYTPPPSPSISNITPSTGGVEGGTIVTINGSGFSSSSYQTCCSFTPANRGVIRVGGQYASVTSYTTSQIVFTVPAGVSAGLVDIYIWNGWNSTTFSNAFTYTPAPAPTITSISPNTVKMVGQSQITITGTNLLNVNSVQVGDKTVGVISKSATQVIFTAPGFFFGGAQDVKVLTSSDSALQANGLTYDAAAQPVISSLSVNQGSAIGGTQVTITGSGFLTHYSYTSGTKNLGYGYIQIGSQFVYPDSISETSLSFTTPLSTSLGATDIVVGNYWNATRLVGGFTYTAPSRPTITAINPATDTAKGGGVISISGTNLAYINTVKFGSVATSPRATSATQLTVIVPPSAITGSVNVQVLNNWDSATASSAFTYSTPTAPTITSISPSTDSLVGGTTVTINGTGFDVAYGYGCWDCGRLGDGYLRFGTINANVISYSDSQIIATVPAGSLSGSVDVTVGNYWTSKTIANGFTYTTPLAPTITSISPTTLSMVKSSVITISGTNLRQVRSVKVGNRIIYVYPNSDTQFTFNSPVSLFSGAADLILNTNWSSVTSSNAFTYSAMPALTVTSMSVATGIASGGTTVVINGTGFLPQYDYCNGICGAGYGYVKFGNNFANIVSYTETSITVLTPISTLVGAVDVVVGSFWDSKKLATKFTYTAPARPTITSISPNSGTALGGSAITISGTNLASVQSIMFGDIYANIQSLTDTRILVASPPSLVVGAVDVKLINPWESVVQSSGFTYTAPATPTITSVSPNSGSVVGGTLVTITGTGFTTPYGYGCWGCGSGYGFVKFGNNYANVRSYTDSQILVEAPQKTTTGAVDITIGNAWSNVTQSAAFTYTSAPIPTITSLSLTTFSAIGSPSATLIGTNFYGINAIYIGKTYVRFSVNSPTQILLSPGIFDQVGVLDLQLVTRWTTVTKSAYITVTAPAAPVITGISSNSGSATGGNTITITGTNLAPIYDYSCWGCAGYNYVTFGGNFANVTSFTDTQIIATVPAASVLGQVDVAVSSIWAKSKLANAYTYTAPPSPTLTSISPSTGSIQGGTTVTITGTGLISNYYKIRVGNSWTGASSISDTSLTFVAPASVEVGLSDITLYNSWGFTTFRNAFTYTPVANPVISSISPISGSAMGGYEITVSGSGFNNAYGFTTDCILCAGYNTLYIGNTPIEVTRYTDTEIVATLPQIADVGNVDVTLKNSWSTTTLTGGLRLTKPDDVQLISITPVTVDASGGFSITLNGSKLSSVSSVIIGDSQVKFAIVSENQIIAYSPWSPTNANVKVQIKSLWSTSTLNNALTFTGGGPVPPDGQIGLSINAGARFTGSRNVKLNLVWPAGATTAYISNDGGFTNALTLVKNLQTDVDWQLDPPGEVPLPALVYVRYNYNDTTYFDDIIIDAVSPILTYASASS